MKSRHYTPFRNQSEIELDPELYISSLPIRYREVIHGHHAAKRELLQRCAIALSYLRDHPKKWRVITESEFWTGKRQVPREGSALLVTQYMVAAKSVCARKASSKYAAAIEFVLGLSCSPDALADKIKELGGISNVYSLSVEARAQKQSGTEAKGKQASQTGGKRLERGVVEITPKLASKPAKVRTTRWGDDQDDQSSFPQMMLDRKPLLVNVTDPKRDRVLALSEGGEAILRVKNTGEVDGFAVLEAISVKVVGRV